MLPINSRRFPFLLPTTIGFSSNMCLWLGLNWSKCQCLLTIYFMFGRVLLSANTRGIRFVLALLGLGWSNVSLYIVYNRPSCISSYCSWKPRFINACFSSLKCFVGCNVSVQSFRLSVNDFGWEDLWSKKIPAVCWFTIYCC